ncbi:hypothetical protein [Streptomyces justiciae]|uniref:hypothetical protein n=1 Tax=Streptomyces justiciae TaxID=2780140 RepID=UPI001D15A48E|nr:hypothetical protein [Streptomyces justiciae]MCW8382528.1 hypothetical protein [Streptomyces justiciae]
MTIQWPGLPGDLPDLEVLGARWALVAVVTATTEAEESAGYRTGTWIDDEGLHLDDCGCTWCTQSSDERSRLLLQLGLVQMVGIELVRAPPRSARAAPRTAAVPLP